MNLITGHPQTFAIMLRGSIKAGFSIVTAKLQRSVEFNNCIRMDEQKTFDSSTSMQKGNFGKKENVGQETIDYKIWILHVRPEVGEDVEFLLTYYARENKGKQFVEETFAKAFKVAHPSWIIKKVTVEEKP